MFEYETDDAFDIDAKVSRNDSIRDYQYFSYNAQQPNVRSRIELRFDDTSKYFLPAEAFIEVEGQLKTDTDAEYLNLPTTNIGFVNNGIMALFKSAEYFIGANRIESIDNDVDVATTILGLARYSDDFIKSAGQSMMFTKDTSDVAEINEYTMRRPKKVSVVADDADVEAVIMGKNADYNAGYATRKKMLNNNGRFSCTIPLSHIFGFCRDVRKVIFGSSHAVVLTRNSSDDYALWKGTGVADGKVDLTKLALWMPVMTPSLDVETRLLSFMDHGGKSLLSWHDVSTSTTTQTGSGVFTWQLALTKNISAPRHVFVALQSVNRIRKLPVAAGAAAGVIAAASQQLRSHMIFDKCDVSEVSLRVSNQQEPAEQLIINFNDNQIGRVYHRLWSFMGRDQNVDTGLQLSQWDFQTNYPIYYFSLQHLDLSKHSTVDVKFQANIRTPPAEGFRAIAVLLSDKSRMLEGGGGRMRIIDAPVENL